MNNNKNNDSKKDSLDSAESVTPANDHTRMAPKKKNLQSGQDKTRIAPPSRNKTPVDDKTRIAQPSAKSIPQDDKTRIASPSRNKRPQNENDKTRVAIKKRSPKQTVSSSGSQPSSDKTQFKPRARPARKTTSDDKTVVARSRAADISAPRSQVPANQASANINDPQKTGLLKERFVLEKVLGAGGMGIVYKAKDLVKVEAGDKDPYIAVKVLTEEFKQHPEAFVALQRESRKTQRIAHPNIMNVHDFDKDGDTVFMTMEYLDGEPLDQLIRQYRSTGLPAEEAHQIVKDISLALIYAHEQNIIHSDFKPGNIFATKQGVSKVFDFGIARAVAKAEHYDDNPEDRTVFDAGDLGALTPSYASAEMLNGLEPDVRDDIYALGCVAYELFTGAHPFNKVPADEAERQKLKPKRINNISRRQWKAVEKALAFKREDRVESVKEFLRLMTETDSSIKIPVAIFTMIAIFVAVYFQFFTEKGSSVSETEIRSELEYRLRLENSREEVNSLVEEAVFSADWEEQLWRQIQSVEKLIEESDTWIKETSSEELKDFLGSTVDWATQTKQNIIGLYRKQILSNIELKKFAETEGLIANGYRYTDDASVFSNEESQLKDAVAKYAEIEEQNRIAEAEAKKQKAARAAKAKKDAAASAAIKQQNSQFNKSLGNLQEQLQCVSNKLNMRNIDTAVQKLRSVNNAKYLKMEGEIISSLTACITRIAKPFPERATEFKKHALRIFKGNKKLSSIVILPRDPCDHSLAGLGARGNRASCKDPIAKLGNGPSMVVIPKKQGIPAFAIGRYEVSIAEFNLFCKSSKKCNEVKGKSASLPITNISIKDVEAYLKWLSSKTKKKYRLPSKKEWLYAAKSKQASLDTNRNCKLNTKGISKGDSLIKASTGKKNGWGLVNYVGNASEWVYDKGRTLVAIGGSYNVPRDKCNLKSEEKHSGKADKYVGFRVYRELRK